MTRVEIQEALAGMYQDKWSDYKADFKWKGNDLEFTVAKMYEHHEVTFADLKCVSEICGTDSINLDTDSMAGCESCDHGSKYETTFFIKNVVCSE